MNAAYEIERLLQFGQKHKLIKGLDVLVARNQLLDLFHLDAPYEGEVPQEEFQYPTELLENLLDLAAQQGLFDNEVNNYRVNFEARIMGCMMPGAQQVAKRFKKLSPITSTSCASTPTTSAPRRSPRTSSGSPPPSTAIWRSPST